MLGIIKQFVKRMLMGKGKGILKIPPQKAVDDFANDLFKKFKQNGVSDEAVNNANDVKAIWNQITNREAQIMSNNMDDMRNYLIKNQNNSTKIRLPKKSAEVFDLKGNKIKNTDDIMGGEEIISEAGMAADDYSGFKEEWFGRIIGNSDEALNTFLKKGINAADERFVGLSKNQRKDFLNMVEYRIKNGNRKFMNDFTDSKGKFKLPDDPQKFYRGGQAEIEPNLSDIGHGSDALMARNALLTPGSQATTSTGLNYLLGEDNDTTRVPYKHGDMVLPKEKPMDEYLLKQVMSQAGANTLDPRTRDMFIQMYKKKIREKNSKAEGGPARQNFGMGKRAFLKWIGSGIAGIGAAKSGLFSLLKGGGKKQVVKEAVKSAGSGTPPPYFFKLVEKIKALGDDVTESAATLDRQKVTKYKDYEMTEDVAGKIEIQKKGMLEGDESGLQLGEEVYMSHTPGETIIGKGKKPIKTKPEYTEDTSYIRTDRGNRGGIHETKDGVPDEVVNEAFSLDEANVPIDYATGGRVPMLWGGGIFKTIIKNLAKARGVNPSEYLKITNYKALPSDVKKYMPKADFEKMKAGRVEMFENWVDMAKTRKEFQESVKAGKEGSPHAAPIFEHLEQSFKSPVPGGVTDKDILQGEFILKNLKTKGRKLHSTGGLAAMLGE